MFMIVGLLDVSPSPNPSLSTWVGLWLSRAGGIHGRTSTYSTCQHHTNRRGNACRRCFARRCQLLPLRRMLSIDWQNWHVSVMRPAMESCATPSGEIMYDNIGRQQRAAVPTAADRFDVPLPPHAHQEQQQRERVGLWA